MVTLWIGIKKESTGPRAEFTAVCLSRHVSRVIIYRAHLGGDAFKPQNYLITSGADLTVERVLGKDNLINFNLNYQMME